MKDIWINTISGRKLNPFHPECDQVTIEDIAHSLSRLNRYTGHIVPEHYSVAEHSILVSQMVEEELEKRGYSEKEILDTALRALLHDASEYAFGDIASPIRKHPAIDGFNLHERALGTKIAEFFDVGDDVVNLGLLSVISEMDHLTIAFEVPFVQPNRNPDFVLPEVPEYLSCFATHPVGLRPSVACDVFLTRFHSLVSIRAELT